MIHVNEATDVDRHDWDNFVDSADDAEIYHLYQWRKIFETVFNNNCHYLIARNESDSVMGILPLVHLKSWVFGNYLVSIPCFNYCGILACDELTRVDLMNSAENLAQRLKASHVELRHRDKTSLSLPYRDDKVSMRLLLPTSEEELWASFPTKMRTRIRRPGKEGAVCVNGGIELLDEFYCVFSRNMRDLGTPVFPKSLFEEICTSFADSAKIFVVRLGGRPVAAGFTLGYGAVLEIPSASALREFNRYAVNMLLYWSILRSAIEQGYRIFDFGRSTVDSGTYQFKKQWGAKPQQLRWHYCLLAGDEIPQLNPQNPKFHIATRVWQRLPLSIANALGPRIVRNLP